MTIEDTINYTIPAACLEALGGLLEEDPPVLIRVHDAISVWHTSWHPLEGWRVWKPGDRILVQQSRPALLAVVERWCRQATDEQWRAMIAADTGLRATVGDQAAREALAAAITAHGSDPGWRVEVLRG